MALVDLPTELSAAIRIVTNLAVFGGIFAWIAWLVGTFVFKSKVPVEPRVIHGIGTGAVAGFVLAGFSLVA